MPCHAGIDDERARIVSETAQSVVDLPVDLPVRFHILIERKDGHSVLLRDLADNRTGGIILRTEAFDQNFRNGTFSAAEVTGKRNLVHD